VTTRGAAFAILLAESHAKVVGELLVPEGMSGDAAAVWLYGPGALRVHLGRVRRPALPLVRGRAG
jgi:hypothetical protein